SARSTWPWVSRAPWRTASGRRESRSRASTGPATVAAAMARPINVGSGRGRGRFGRHIGFPDGSRAARGLKVRAVPRTTIAGEAGSQAVNDYLTPPLEASNREGCSRPEHGARRLSRGSCAGPATAGQGPPPTGTAPAGGPHAGDGAQ